MPFARAVDQVFLDEGKRQDLTPFTRYPSKPIRVIVGSAPGGGTNLIARVVGQKLGESVGQQVIVENRTGAGSTIGFEAGVRAAPDGYTFTLITPSWAINPSLYPIRFDPLVDYTPVVLVAPGPLVIVVHPSLPARNVRELIALAKAERGQRREVRSCLLRGPSTKFS